MRTMRRFTDWIGLIGTWRRRAIGRQRLAAMSERALQDIGITPLDARCEAEKPFWRE